MISRNVLETENAERHPRLKRSYGAGVVGGEKRGKWGQIRPDSEGKETTNTSQGD